MASHGAGWHPGMGHPLVKQLPGNERGLETYTWNIVWDQQGTAYLGRDHLWRWDGQRLQRIGAESFLALRGMIVGPEGNVWLAGVNQFGAYDPATESFTSFLHWLPEEHRRFGEAWILHHDGEAIWMGTDHLLFRMTSTEFSVWEFGEEHRVIFHFLASGIYAHETDVGLWRIHDGQKDLINTDPSFASKSVLFLEDYDEGGLLGVSGNGVYRLGENGILSMFTPNIFGSVQLSSISRVNSTEIAIGTLGHGAFLLNQNNGRFTKLGTDHNFSSKLIVNLVNDPYGNLYVLEIGIWIIQLSTPGGIFYAEDGFFGGYLKSIHVSRSHLCIASGNGLFSKEIDPHIEKIEGTLTKLYGGEVANSANFSEGCLFSRYDTLHYTEGGKVEELHAFGRVISTFAVSGAGELYVAFPSEVGVYGIDAGRELHKLGMIGTVSNLQFLKVDGSGHAWGWAPRAPLVEIWVDTNGGVQMREHARIGEKDLERTDCRLAVTETGPVLIFKNAVSWMGDDGEGWETESIDQLEDLPEAYAFEASEGGLEGWMVDWDSEEQFYKVLHLERESEGGPLEMSILPWPDMKDLGTITQILPVSDPIAGFIIGGSKGILLAGEELPEQIPLPQQPVVSDSLGQLDLAEPNIYSFGKDAIEFYFQTPDAGGYYKKRFQSRLEGEEDWTAPTSLNMREIGQLFEGDYTLEVRTVDPFGRTSVATVVSFKVLPPWYRTPLAYLSGILLVFLCIHFWVRFRVRRVQRKNRELERIVDERTLRLKEASRIKDDFIDNLSHEIRNPLNGIIGLIQQMREGISPPPLYLKALRGAADYLQSTVEEVLDFSKLQSGTVQMEDSLIDIAAVGEGVVEIYRGEAHKKGLVFSSRINVPEKTGIVTDLRKIQQLIGNLTGNAVKFTESGYVRVELDLHPEGKNEGTLRLHVEDSGPGVGPGEKEKIFEKFYQVQSKGSGKNGTGIGLALVKGYVDLMGGQLDLETSPGKGSTFRVRLPVETATLPELEDDDGSTAGRGQRILIVEDVEYNRMVIEDLLKSFGCEVESAERGRQGLELGLKGTHDAIFLDWELPEMNGMEIARALRESGKLAAHTKIIALTAYATRDIEEQCLASGMDAFLTKPIRKDQVRRLLFGKTPIPFQMEESDVSADPGMDSDGIVLGRGNLGELARDSDWPTVKARFEGFMETYLKELTGAMEVDDPEDIRQCAHKFLGFFRMIEVNELPEILQSIQEAAREEDLALAREQWELFKKRLPEFKQEWERL